MTHTQNVQSVTSTDKKQSCQAFKGQDDLKAPARERVIGEKPAFENGYVTMNEEGLAIAMIPRQTQ